MPQFWGGEVLSGFPLFLKEIFSEIVGGKRASAHILPPPKGRGKRGKKEWDLTVHAVPYTPLPGEKREWEKI